MYLSINRSKTPLKTPGALLYALESTILLVCCQQTRRNIHGRSHRMAIHASSPIDSYGFEDHGSASYTTLLDGLAPADDGGRSFKSIGRRFGYAVSLLV
jgi:hypothetical protein